MVSLMSLAEKMASTSVFVRGEVEIKIRAISARETERILVAFPPPVPPMMPDPDAGSLAPKVPNLRDQAYLQALNAWDRRYRNMHIAAASDLETGYARGLSDVQLREVLVKAEQSVAEAFTETELARIWKAVVGLADNTAPERARQVLLANLEGAPVDETVQPVDLPPNYGTTKAFAILEVCRQFHIDPRQVDELEPGLLALLIEHVRVVDRIAAKPEM